MIIIKSDEEIDLMRISGKVTGTILKELEVKGINMVEVGICGNHNTGSRNDTDL